MNRRCRSVAIGVGDLDVDPLAQHHAWQWFAERAVGNLHVGGADHGDLGKDLLLQCLRRGVLIEIGHGYLVVALDFQLAAVRLRVAQPRWNGAQHDPDVASDRKATDCFDVAAGNFAADLDGVVGTEHSQIGVFDLHKQRLPASSFSTPWSPSASVVPTFSNASIARR